MRGDGIIQNVQLKLQNVKIRERTIETKNKGNKYEIITNIAVIHLTISKITLNTNSLNTPIKQQKLSKWTRKQDVAICCIPETHFKSKDTQIHQGIVN